MTTTGPAPTTSKRVKKTPAERLTALPELGPGPAEDEWPSVPPLPQPYQLPAAPVDPDADARAASQAWRIGYETGRGRPYEPPTSPTGGDAA